MRARVLSDNLDTEARKGTIAWTFYREPIIFIGGTKNSVWLLSCTRTGQVEKRSLCGRKVTRKSTVPMGARCAVCVKCAVSSW